MDAINLNAGVSIKTLYADATEEQIAQIEEASTDGFTEDELQKLEDDGIDTSLIKNNAAKADGAAKKPDTSVEDKAAEIREKYCQGLAAATGDAYSASNPELKALSDAMNDGLIKELGEAGYSKNEIVDIINQAFPSVGISNTADGKYQCPHGHGDEAQGIYDKFVQELASATSVDPQKLIEAQNKLLKISNEIADNNRSLKALEYNITMLQGNIEDKINDAIEESEDIVEDQQEDAKNIVSKRLNEYTSSNGEMTYEEFQRNVGNDLDNLSGTANSKLSSAVAKIISAQRDMTVLNGYMNKMSGLIDSNAQLSADAKSVQDEIQTIKDEAAAASASGSDEDCQRCDPIGFSDAEGTRFDFFVDKDSDGNVTNENEFLGAENGFQEMIDADVDGDGKVTASELDSQNVKVVVTNEDGSQEIKNASEVLKESDSINLSSYQAQNTELDNGNALLGTFSVEKDGQTLDTGYQTLDKLDWLDNNFEFSDEINGVGRHMNTEGEVTEALDYSEQFDAFNQKFDELKTKEKDAEVKLGLDSEEVKSGIANAAEMDANKKASTIQEAFKRTQAKEEQAAEAEEKAAAEAEEKAAAEAEEKAEAEKLEEEA